jgi:hypothetical protein
LTLHDFLSIPGPEHLSVAPLKLTLEEIEQIEEIDVGRLRKALFLDSASGFGKGAI